MKSTAHAFKAQAKQALKNEVLQQALARTKSHFIDKRQAAIAALPIFESLRQRAKEIKEHTLAHLDFYLEQLEQQVQAHGGQVHWATSPQLACQQILSICQAANAKKIIKGKSMISEEIALNFALEKAGFQVIETDLGEYIIQLAKEPPSHIIAPAVHKTRQQVADLFFTHHQKYGFKQSVSEIPALVDQARQVLRQHFLSADVGITGANFLVAETGSIVLVTNEGNGDLTSILPKTHIVVASIEKVIPTLTELSTFLRLLARSATGQEITSYTTLYSGPRRADENSGPTEFHLVLVDNGRSEMLGNEFKEMLNCIHCGACLNHCPIYGALGGHAYGWVYPGPMGSVLTPLMLGEKAAKDLPNASTLCGRCEDVCPVKIPLPKLLRQHRAIQHQEKLPTPQVRWALSLWGWLATKPRLYQTIMAMSIPWLTWWGGKRGRFRYLPLADGWTKTRDLPAPTGQTFMAAWRKKMVNGKRRDAEAQS